MNISENNLQKENVNDLLSVPMDFNLSATPNKLQRVLGFVNDSDFFPIVLFLIGIKLFIGYFNADGLYYFAADFLPSKTAIILCIILIELFCLYLLHLGNKYILLGKGAKWQGILCFSLIVAFFALEFYACPKGWHIKQAQKVDNTGEISSNFGTKENETKARFERSIKLYENQIQRLETLNSSETSETKKKWNIVKIGRLNDSINAVERQKDLRLQSIENAKNNAISVNDSTKEKQGQNHANTMYFLLGLQLITSFAIAYIFHNTARKKYGFELSKENTNALQVNALNTAEKIQNELANISQGIDNGLVTMLNQSGQILNIGFQKQVTAYKLALNGIVNGTTLQTFTPQIDTNTPQKNNKKGIGFLHTQKGETETFNENRINENRINENRINENRINETTANTLNNRVCKHCGKPYIHTHHKQEYCNELCRIAAWELRTGKKFTKPFKK